MEFGEDGIPLGRWEWDEDLEEWVFDEYIPLADLNAEDIDDANDEDDPQSLLPYTGIQDDAILLTILLLAAIVSLAVVIDALIKVKTRIRK